MYKSKFISHYLPTPLEFVAETDFLYLFFFKLFVSLHFKVILPLYLHLFIGGLMSYFRCLCLFAHSGAQHILCCVFLRIVYSMLPASLDCPFVIIPSVFTDVCSHTTKKKLCEF